MFGLILRVKDYFSHVQDSSWHYKVVDGIWTEKWLRNSHACSYYWFKLPVALVASFAILLFATVFTLVLGFTGRVPAFVPSNNEEMKWQKGEFAYPYKRLPNGWKMRLAPWEIAILTGFIYALYYTFAFDFWPGLWLVIGLALLSFVMFGIYLLTTGWNTPPFIGARAVVKEAWDRVCPPLVIEYSNLPSELEESGN